MNGKQVAITRENGFREALKHDFNVFLLDFPKVNTILFLTTSDNSMVIRLGF